MTRQTLLYTEMVTAPALVRGGALRLLEHDPAEHPVALQLGGSDPVELKEATRLAVEAGFVEVNLNVGCPSDRVQSGTFGAVLMKSPALVAECVTAMQEVDGVEVTVKCRIGVDDQNAAEVLPDFVGRMVETGVARMAVHARKAWLKGLSPKENREVPPLDYPLVYRLKERFPTLHLSINGGVMSLDEAERHLDTVDGVMIGRAAYHTPGDVLLDADRRIFGDQAPSKTAEEVVHQMVPYIEDQLRKGVRLHGITRHMLGLFAGRPGARAWRRTLSEGAQDPKAGPELLLAALDHIDTASAAA